MMEERWWRGDGGEEMVERRWWRGDGGQAMESLGTEARGGPCIMNNFICTMKERDEAKEVS